MALDPRIALTGQGTDVMSAISGGLNVGDRIRNMGVRDAILRQQQQMGQMTIEQTQQQQALKGMQTFGNALKGIRNVPLADRAKLIAQQLPMLESIGVGQERLSQLDLSDAGLDNTLLQLQPFMAQQANAAKFQFGASNVIKGEDGKLYSITQRRNPNTGEVQGIQVPIDGELVSNIGETAEERKAREVETAGEKQEVVGNIQTEQAVEEIEAVREAELTTAQALQEIATRAKQQEALTANQVARLDKAIETGLSAVSSMPDINRGLELLREIETGGMTAKAKAVTDFFGTTSGDVGELNNILARNVLAGLSAFTGAISEGEREFIERMDTSLSQGTGFNIAQLNTLRNIYQREIKNGLSAAEIAGDEFAIGIFNDSMKADATGFAGQVEQINQQNIDFVNNL